MDDISTYLTFTILFVRTIWTIGDVVATLKVINANPVTFAPVMGARAYDAIRLVDAVGAVLYAITSISIRLTGSIVALKVAS